MTLKVVGSILRTCKFQYNITRLSSNFPKESSPPKRSTAVAYEYGNEEAKKIRFYFLRRYLQYMKNSNKLIEQRFPTAYLTYRVFVDGLKEFYVDLKSFVRIVRALNISGADLNDLTRKEIELYHQMPKDIMKMGPLLIFSTFPFAYYVVLPLIYLFPRQLMTSHFWNLQQKSEFSVLELKQRLMNNRPVFRHVQAKLKSLKGHQLYCSWKNILGMLGSGVQPSTDKILVCKDLFAEKPYDLRYLSRSHVKDLLKMHGVHVGFFRRRTRLRKHGTILLAMDKAILKEGGVHNLPVDALRKACLIRGLNPSNLTSEELVCWLEKWMKISKQVDDENISLLLHSPILLAYNEQSNWTLIYLKK